MTFVEILTYIGQTIGMTVISTVFAYILGLPTGILLNITSKNGLKPCKPVNVVLGLIVNILRSVPCLIVIVVCFDWTRAWFGTATGEWYTILIPLTICAYGLVSRMVEQSLAEVPAGEIEAVKSLGASNFQLITKVLLPEARVSLVTGAAVVAVSILGYTSFANNIGAGGLIDGIYIFYTRNTGDYLSKWLFWVLIILVVVLVQLIQEAGVLIAKKIDKRRRISNDKNRKGAVKINKKTNQGE